MKLGERSRKETNILRKKVEYRKINIHILFFYISFLLPSEPHLIMSFSDPDPGLSIIQYRLESNPLFPYCNQEFFPKFYNYLKHRLLPDRILVNFIYYI